MIERLSVDARVLLQPARTYRAIGTRTARAEARAHVLQDATASASAWRAWRRPLFVTFFIGGCLSIAASGALTLRLALSAAVSWSFVPLIAVGALAVVLSREERRRFGPIVDLFCSGFGAYLLWTFGLAFIVSCVPIRNGVPIFGTYVYGGAALALAWSVYIDYCFFRDGLGRSPTGARTGVLLHRALCWAPVVLIFGQPGIHTELLEWLGK